ncbi:aspartate aminotransferase family protein [Streptomyces sp. SAJ15]|uniref:aspartate aminotransferase family protein n=1 Tax=Streptomyces sp. SAJ15 TaxID=2011095 RepID=UPI0011855555|nr:diaminobutyrate--2-oxoglutarate transaminase family protein [Streptomyces sp. SAJ15]TVL93001.1 diaminobutyrate--2-oxoglutarate transaminase [Streptomyces sp. SAJ15]
MTHTPPSAGVPQTPRVTGEVPGPRSREYLERQARRESTARSYPYRLPIAIARAQGAYIEDVDGNVFLDFLAGAGVLSLGHNHPDVIAAVADQLGVFVHGLDFPTPVKDRFTELQLAQLPEPMRERTRIHFCGPTGANAVDAALKLCKTATGREDVIAFQGGFHGATLAAMSVTGLVSQKEPVRGRMPGAHFFPYGGSARCPVGLHPDGCNAHAAAFLEHALTDPNGGVPLPAAVIMELVQGEGGVVPADVEFVQRVRAITRELGVPLIVDEVQTGCGRTGTWFAFEQYGIEPDVVVASKALSGVGLPVAIILYDEKLDSWAPGAHTGTFRGNQLAFAAGVAALDVYARENTLANVAERGRQLLSRLEELKKTTDWVGDVRGLGLMQGVELTDPVTGRPAGGLAKAVQAGALRRGLILEVGGRDDCVVRMLPPLNITAADVDIAADIIAAALAEALAETVPTVQGGTRI